MSAPRLPNSLKYWTESAKKKKGKDVMIYFHDDLDGIFSAIVIRNYLQKNNFNIIGYGVVNYQESWNVIKIDKDVINVAVDFAETHPDVDVYIDHHGEAFGDTNKNYAIKTATSSAYEGICLQLGMPCDDLVLSVIDMVDSAKYEEYGVDIVDTINFDLDYLKSKNKLSFAAAFNQLIKRGDYKTLIEVAHNTPEPSVFNIYRNFKKYYPENNIIGYGSMKGMMKQFISDAKWRMNQVRKKTRGSDNLKNKRRFESQEEFILNNTVNNNICIKGYQIIGDIAYIPSGTWANPIRARAILEEDLRKGIIEKQPKLIMLIYGDTIQMVSYDKLEKMSEDELPITRKGEKLSNIGHYMEKTIDNFKKHFDYCGIQTKSNVQDDYTVAGGHKGIGTISNICGRVSKEHGHFAGLKFTDFIQNKIIQDLSGVKWNNLRMRFSSNTEFTPRENVVKINQRVLKIENIRCKK